MAKYVSIALASDERLFLFLFPAELRVNETSDALVSGDLRVDEAATPVHRDPEAGTPEQRVLPAVTPEQHTRSSMVPEHGVPEGVRPEQHMAETPSPEQGRPVGVSPEQRGTSDGAAANNIPRKR